MTKVLFFLLTLFIFVPSNNNNIFQWEKEVTPHFILHYSPSASPWVKNLLGQIENYRKRVQEFFGISVEDKVHIFLVGSYGDLSQIKCIVYDKFPLWASGLAIPQKKIIILTTPSLSKGESFSLVNTFIHEYTHLVIEIFLQGKSIPRWLNEGMAMYVSGQKDFYNTLLLSKAFVFSSLIPFEQLKNSFPVTSSEIRLAYAQSFNMVSYLMDHFGRERFYKFLKFIRSGIPFKKAFFFGFGENFSSVENSWKKSLKRKLLWLPAITSSLTLWFFLSLLVIIAYFKRLRRKKRWEGEDDL